MSKKVSFEEWKFRVNTKTNNSFNLLEVKYEKQHSKSNRKEAFLYIEHLDCGHKFKRRGGQWLKTQSCPRCLNLMKVSYLHAIVCLLFDKYYDHVEFEKDIGFKGYNGGKSKYDLFVPDYNGHNILIEFQSIFHDGKEIFDKEKAEFAFNNGYIFYSIDHRKNETLDIFHGFFPFLKEIPEWVFQEFYKFQKPDLSILQELLNMELPASKICEITGLSEAIILNAIKNNIVKRTDNHMSVVYNIKPIVQLSLDGEFIREYPAINQVKKAIGINPISALKGISKHAGGFLWIYKEKYLIGDYTIPNKNKLRICETS